MKTGENGRKRIEWLKRSKAAVNELKLLYDLVEFLTTFIL